MDIIPLHLIWIQFWTNSCWTLFKTEIFPTVASSVLLRCPSTRIERWMFFPQFQRCPGSSCSSSNRRVRSGVTHCGLHSAMVRRKMDRGLISERRRGIHGIFLKKFLIKKNGCDEFPFYWKLNKQYPVSLPYHFFVNYIYQDIINRNMASYLWPEYSFSLKMVQRSIFWVRFRGMPHWTRINGKGDKCF